MLSEEKKVLCGSLLYHLRKVWQGFFKPRQPIKGVPHLPGRAATLSHWLRAAQGRLSLGANMVMASVPLVRVTRSVLFSLLEFYLGAISSISSSRSGAILTIVYLSMLLFDLLESPNPRLNLFEFDCGTVPPPVKYCHTPWTPRSAHRTELTSPAFGSVLPGISSILRAIFILDLGPSHATPLACGY